MKRIILALMIAVVVAGCNSPKKIPKVAPKVVVGTSIPRHAVQTVRGYEIVSTYHLGRRIDPNNPNIMYEAGKMYVVRRSPSWNLRPNTPVSNPAFKNHVNPIRNKYKEMERLQKLRSKALSKLEKVKFQLLKNQQSLNKINEKHPKNDLQASIEKLNKDLGKIKRRMAEL
jgi:Prokaryotic membrane lipoprotein lipid attachment site